MDFSELMLYFGALSSYDQLIESVESSIKKYRNAAEKDKEEFQTGGTMTYNGDTVIQLANKYGINPDKAKELIAKAASPKVSADNVSIAFSDSTDPYLASDRPANRYRPLPPGHHRGAARAHR